MHVYEALIAAMPNCTTRPFCPSKRSDCSSSCRSGHAPTIANAHFINGTGGLKSCLDDRNDMESLKITARV
eukprot:4999216-Pleurochrysis_carterae.AAC.1